ncbi:serine/threonine-protein kinase [Umezawaea endophytica]|uniref:non-specific serine/threonine protein kinase n=1 Tax=Umezawaea endophytica TaxID=1654476 RepID=A0A9X2VX70_9PSEU|nr:serine/threonine-protein kinase [Umezawaea endophytica]MCS7484310.1 serine/threonine protein kinase [Umezawaea endophytica]
MENEQPERLIGERYRLRHVLGRGSMGVVWAAHDEVLRRDVAVKEVLRPPGTTDAEADELRERTMREARSVARLSHPNLVTLYDVVQLDGDPYVVMELVPSSSLADLIRLRGPLTLEQGAAVADAVAAALASAHKAGITHRDVKPGNVLIADDGRIKLTDFGIARNVADATMTSRGIMLGTPSFISPEVASGAPLTTAADLWSLGATLWAAMSGQPPYEGTNVLRTINAVVHADVPPPVGADGLAPVISGLMVKDADGRMPLAEVRRLVRPLLAEPGVDLFPTTPSGTADPSEADTAVTRSAARAGGARTVVRPPLVVPKPVIPDDAPLAADPGPLPFTRQTAATRSLAKPRGPARTVLLAVVALLVFAASGVGGFALTRFVAGAPLLPPQRTSAPSLPSIGTTLELVPRRASAASANGDQGAEFTISVGADWTTFVEQRVNDDLPASTTTHLVAPNGLYEVAVQRFGGFYPKWRVEDYLGLVRSHWPEGRYFSESVAALPGVPGNDFDAPVQLGYRTVEPALALTRAPEQPGPDLRRSRFSRVLPHGSDLWVVEVVFPTDQEETGRAELFDTIVGTFSAAG